VRSAPAEIFSVSRLFSIMEPPIERQNLTASTDYRNTWAFQEGFGTLSRRLGNDEGYRSSCVGVSRFARVTFIVSGWFTRWPAWTHVLPVAAAAAVEKATDGRNRIGCPSDTGPGFDVWAGSARVLTRAYDARPRLPLLVY
jgi:hypothetical protein